LKLKLKWTLGAALLGAMAGVLLLAGQMASGAELRFDAEKGFPISLGDTVLIESETQSWPESGKAKVLRSEKLLTLPGEYSRREFAGLGDRLEYTFQFNLPPSDEAHTYCLSLPLPRNRKVLVTHGDYSRLAKTDEFTIGDKNQTLTFARFITVPPSGEVAGFSIDLDPAGAWQDFGDFDKPIRQSRIKITDEGLQICFARSWNKWGHGRIRAKLVFYPQPVAFETLHPYSVAGYKQPLEALYFLDFTSRERTRPPLSVGTQAFDAQRGYGWPAPPAALKIVDRSPAALLHSGFATADQRAVFQMQAPPGDYLLTVIAGDLEKPVGPMKISVNGQQWLDNLKSEAAQFAAPHTVISTADGRIALAVEGAPWVLNGIILQPLMTASEDYRVRQKWWRHDMAWPNENVWPSKKTP
jgi:hypothetical protein